MGSGAASGPELASLYYQPYAYGREYDGAASGPGRRQGGAGRAEVGYDDQELFAGVRAVAAPIVDARDRRVAVVMVVGFKERVDLRTLRRIGERCVSAARAVSQRIGAEAA